MKKIIIILLVFLFGYVSNSWADAKVMKCKTKIGTFIYKLKDKKAFIRSSGWVPLAGSDLADQTYNDGAVTLNAEDEYTNNTYIIDFKYLQYKFSLLMKGKAEKYSIFDVGDCTKIE